MKYNIFVIIFSIFCLAMNANAATNPTREFEPNNNMTSATAIFIGDGEVRGQLSSDTDIDYYVFNSTGSVVSFTISPVTSSYDGTSLSASILAQDGSVLTSNDIKSDSKTVTLSANTTSGTYYLVFNENQHSVMRKDYVINSAYAPTLKREFEPNNNMASATTISDGEIRGQLSSGTDTDYYAFNSAGGVVGFAISPVTRSYDGTSLSASILAQDGSVLTSNDIKSDSTTVTLSANTTSGIYYLVFNENQHSVMRKDYVINASGLSLVVPLVTLSGLSLACPSTINASASGLCSATASYSDASSKAVSASWGSSNATVLYVGSGGSLAAGTPSTDTAVTISASYTENGAIKIATQSVTVKTTAVTALKGLSAICPSTINAGASAACSATATYSDGASKAVNATWASGNTSVVTVSGVTVTANAGVTTDAPVMLTASYAENGVTQTATAMVTVKAAVPATTSACSGSGVNLSAITIVGNATKQLGDALEVNYCLKNFNSATKFDIYVAVQLPDSTLMFLQTSGFFQTASFSIQVTPYLANTLIPDKSGPVLSLPVLPLALPTGTYVFYAIPVPTGKDLYNFVYWVGNLAKEQMNLIK